MVRHLYWRMILDLIINKEKTIGDLLDYLIGLGVDFSVSRTEAFEILILAVQPTNPEISEKVNRETGKSILRKKINVDSKQSLAIC